MCGVVMKLSVVCLSYAYFVGGGGLKGVLVLRVEDGEEAREGEFGSDTARKFARPRPSRQQAFGLGFKPLAHTRPHAHISPSGELCEHPETLSYAAGNIIR